MRPPKQATDFERVKTGDFIEGKIIDVEYDMKHAFRGKFAREAAAIRLIFELKNYKYKKRTRWMTFSLSEKSNLYKKYASGLIEGAYPDMEVDLDMLKGMEVKTIWEGDDYQSVELIRPLREKLKVDFSKAPEVDLDDPANMPPEEEPPGEEIPF